MLAHSPSLQALVGYGPYYLWSYYLHQLSEHPVQTKAFTSFVSAAIGDALAQHLVRTPGTPGRR